MRTDEEIETQHTLVSLAGVDASDPEITPSHLPTVADVAAGAVVNHDAVRAAIKTLVGVKATKDFADRLKAIEDYFIRSKKSGAEAIAFAQDRLWAERACGLEIKAMEKAVGGGAYHASAAPRTKAALTKTLAEIDISYDLSSQFQQQADIPEDVYETLLNKGGEIPSRAGVLRAAAELFLNTAQSKKKQKAHTGKANKTTKTKKPDGPQSEPITKVWNHISGLASVKKTLNLKGAAEMGSKSKAQRDNLKLALGLLQDLDDEMVAARAAPKKEVV